jgi:hypothetical protein
VQLHARRITVHEAERRVKSAEAVRDLPIAAPLERALAGHLARVAPGPADLLFPGAVQVHEAVRRAWNATCEAAGRRTWTRTRRRSRIGWPVMVMRSARLGPRPRGKGSVQYEA